MRISLFLIVCGVVLAGCGSSAPEVPADQNMSSQVKGLQNGPAGGKNSSKAGGPEKLASPPSTTP